MTKITVDTNILISAIFWRGKPNKIITLCFEGALELVISRAILNELERILVREKKFDLTHNNVFTFLDIILDHSILVEPIKKLDVVKKDPSDNKILECAIAGNVNYIISGDSHLLELKEYESIKIVTAAEFLTIFSKSDSI